MRTLYDIIVGELGMTEDDYDYLVEQCEVLVLEDKSVVLEEGGVCDFIDFVEEGVLRIYREKDGEQLISDFHMAGSFSTSYRSFISQEPSVASIQVLKKCKVMRLSKVAYDRLLNEFPIWYKLAKYIADELFIKKCVKENSLLMDSAYDRYKLLLKTYPMIDLFVAQYHIASYLGIKPESLSRIKSLNIGQGN